MLLERWLWVMFMNKVYKYTVFLMKKEVHSVLDKYIKSTTVALD